MSYESEVEQRNSLLEKKIQDLEDEIGYLQHYYNQYIYMVGTCALLLDNTYDFAEHGTRVDTNPTITGEQDLSWWYSYIQSADSNIRRRAGDVINDIKGEIGPKSDFDINSVRTIAKLLPKPQSSAIVEVFEKLLGENDE